MAKATAQDEKVLTTESLLQIREKTHGSFSTNASMFAYLQTGLDVANGSKYSKVQKLALTQINLKLARLYQNPEVVEHWKDIAGYAQLVVKDMEF